MDEKHRLARALGLQQHLASERLVLAKKPVELYERLGARLRAACDEQLLSTPADINGLLKMSRDRTVITCGPTVRNFKHDSTLPCVRRIDGATFDFALTLSIQGRSAVEILAYDYEIRFATAEPSFVRFDLNPPSHDNAADGFRSHVHISSNDDGMSVPGPCLTPDEALDLLIFGMGRTGRVRHLREIPQAG